MSENFALYSSVYNSLPEEHMMTLALPVLPKKITTERGLTYIYQWEDNLQVICSVMPKEQIQNHLQGFCGYIRKISLGDLDKANKLIDTIKSTTLTVGVEIIPARDSKERAERAENIIGSLCYGLKPIIFHDGAIFNCNSELIYASDGTAGKGSPI